LNVVCCHDVDRDVSGRVLYNSGRFLIAYAAIRNEYTYEQRD